MHNFVNHCLLKINRMSYQTNDNCKTNAKIKDYENVRKKLTDGQTYGWRTTSDQESKFEPLAVADLMLAYSLLNLKDSEQNYTLYLICRILFLIVTLKWPNFHWYIILSFWCKRNHLTFSPIARILGKVASTFCSAQFSSKHYADEG